MKNPKILSILVAFVFIFSLNLASSQALIAGKIYNSDFSNTIDGADISVTCNSNTLNTNSLSDGTYAVRFDETICSEGSSISIVAKKSGFDEKTDSGVIRKCEEENCEEEYVSINNLGLKAASKSGNTGSSGDNSGGSIGYFLCGNKKCDTGETTKTCPKDCPAPTPTPVETIVLNDNAENADTNTEVQTDVAKEPFYSVILGAVVGADGKIRLIVPIIFIALIIVIGIFVFIRRRN